MWPESPLFGALMIRLFDVKFSEKSVSSIPSLSVEDPCLWVCGSFVGTEPPSCGPTTVGLTVGELGAIGPLKFAAMDFTNLSASSRLIRPLLMQMRTKTTQKSTIFISKRHPAGRVLDKNT